MTNNGELTQAERSKRHYQYRKEKGLCPRCGRVLDRDGHYCLDCLERNRKYRNETRRFLREHHLCTECGKVRVYGDEKKCPECRAKLVIYKKPKTDEQRIERNRKFSEYQKILYKQRSEQGICTRCGKRPAAAERKKCAMCLIKDAERHRISGISRSERPNYGVCYRCGEPITNKAKKLCDKCCETNRNNLESHKKKNDFWKSQNKLIFKN